MGLRPARTPTRVLLCSVTVGSTRNGRVIFSEDLGGKKSFDGTGVTGPQGGGLQA